MSNFEPSLSAMRLMVEIVRTGKLTSASSRLHISQSGASHALRALESQVGTALFVRESEGLRLSEAGQRLLPLIEQVLANLDAIRTEAGGQSRLWFLDQRNTASACDSGEHWKNIGAQGTNLEQPIRIKC